MEPLAIATPRIDPTAFVADTAVIRGDVTVGPAAVVMFGVVVRAEFDRIEIGESTNLQDNVVLHADKGRPCVIGDRVTVGHAAVVHGATVGDNCLVGIGAIVLNGAKMGQGSWVAAGGVLPEGKSIPPWTIAVGIPARPVRELTEDEIARQRDGVADYLRIAAALRRQ
jgi:carbonic anhydrase/acetyltransferase-like protein (isoleucine patch superfamily)